MSLPQAIVRGVGGAVSVDLLSRPTSATVQVLDGQGAAVASGSATVSSASSTLAAAAARGATSISVAVTTGIAAGSVIWLQDDPEPVLVYKVTANVVGPPAVAGTVYLRRPLLKAHVSSAVVQGTTLSYTVAAADAASRFWDGRVKWTLNDGSVEYSEVECVEYPFKRRATLQDLWDACAQTYEVLEPTVDTERLLDLGLDEVLQRIGAKGRARCFTGSSAFKRANALAAWMLHWEGNATAEGVVLFERYKASLGEELDRVVASSPRDENQDGVIGVSEKISMRNITLRR